MKKILMGCLSIAITLSLLNLHVFAEEKHDEASFLEDVTVEEQENGTYAITAKILDPNAIESLEYEVWTTYGGKDDVKATTIYNLDEIKFVVDRENHNKEFGEYELEFHVVYKTGEKDTYVMDSILMKETKSLYKVTYTGDAVAIEKKDINENNELKNNEADQEKQNEKSINDSKNSSTLTNLKSNNLMISDVQITKVNNGCYKISAKINPSYEIDRIEFPTWTHAKGQDDITWGMGTINGNTVTYTVDMKEHKYETGNYVTHIYAYDKGGNQTFYAVPMQIISNNVPSIKDVKVTNSAGRYTITATVSDDYGIDKVEFPTWTQAKGQDDIIWGKGTINGNTVTYTIDMKDHKYETGNYVTHIYAYDKGGKQTFYAIPTQSISNNAPSIKDVKVTKNAGKYTITATVNDDYGIDRIEFPTWTQAKGQDDITWGKGTINGNTVTYTVDMKDHKYETGNYVTHIYAYDKGGKQVFYALPMQSIINNAPSIKNVKVKNSAGRYTITATVSDDYGIDRIEFPTWTQAKGQDDITWGEGIINGNTVTYTVDMKDHKYETGNYVTHIYAYDKGGKQTFYAIPTQSISNKAPSIKDVKVTKNAGKYTITATVSDDYGIDKAEFPTWTQAKGQDDITWGKGTINGNTVTYTVDMKDHNYEIKDYITHIYIYDKGGKQVFYALPMQSIINNAPSIKNVKVTNSAGKYTITATVSDDYGIDKVEFPTWTQAKGQDDITWGKGTINGNTVTYTVDMKDHNYETESYETQIYAYDKGGNLTYYMLPIQIVNNAPPAFTYVDIVKDELGSYTIACEVSDDYGLDYVNFATWTSSNGQDDIIWTAVPIVEGKAALTIYASDHGYESGQYITHMYVYDKGGKSSFIQVTRNMQAPEMQAGWKVIDGRKYLFNNSGDVVSGASKLVIDISEHNGNIDWDKVKSSGVDAVILRCGYGWSDEINEQIDKKFIQNAEALERLGIPYGVYLFSYENSVWGAQKEAEYTLKLISGRKISLPVYYDIEYSSYTGELSKETYVAMANAYCDIINNAGYTAGIYANLNYWNNKLNDSSLDKYIKWVAQYNMNDGYAGHCDYTKPYTMWQYTSVGSVYGIGGNVDMNALFE